MKYTEIVDWMIHICRALAHRAVEQDDEDGVALYVHAARAFAAIQSKDTNAIAKGIKEISQQLTSRPPRNAAEQEALNTIQTEIKKIQRYMAS